MDINNLNEYIDGTLMEATHKTAREILKLIPSGPEVFISEDIFVNYFLPRFVGVVPNPGNWVVEWISIAGTPTAEVGVRGAGGEMLFSVPPLLQTKGLAGVSGTGGLNDIFTRYKMISNNIPREGIRFLFAELANKSKELLEEFSLTETEATWMSIMGRYGYLDTGEGGQESQGSSTSFDNTAAEDLFDFD